MSTFRKKFRRDVDYLKGGSYAENVYFVFLPEDGNKWLTSVVIPRKFRKYKAQEHLYSVFTDQYREYVENDLNTAEVYKTNVYANGPYPKRKINSLIRHTVPGEGWIDFDHRHVPDNGSYTRISNGFMFRTKEPMEEFRLSALRMQNEHLKGNIFNKTQPKMSNYVRTFLINNDYMKANVVVPEIKTSVYALNDRMYSEDAFQITRSDFVEHNVKTSQVFKEPLVQVDSTASIITKHCYIVKVRLRPKVVLVGGLVGKARGILKLKL